MPHATPRAPRGARQAALVVASQSTTDDCVIMESNQTRPYVNFRGKHVTASRAVWTLANGDPGAQHVLHTCNGGSGSHGCINIRHLYLGTHERNQADKVASGRQGREFTIKRTKLSDEQAREIKSRYVRGHRSRGPGNVSALAAEYRVTEWTIVAIANGFRRQLATQN